MINFNDGATMIDEDTLIHNKSDNKDKYYGFYRKFHQYFQKDLQSSTIKTSRRKLDPKEDFIISDQVDIYVKKWKRVKFGIVFILTNGLIQVQFKDNSEILIDREVNKVWYFPQDDQPHICCSKKDAMLSKDPELMKRLTLVKCVVGNKKPSSPNLNALRGSPIAKTRFSSTA